MCNVFIYVTTIIHLLVFSLEREVNNICIYMHIFFLQNVQ